MLLFDQQHYEASKTYKLTTPCKNQAFAFRDALSAKAFIDYYYHNPVAAAFAYYATETFSAGETNHV